MNWKEKIEELKNAGFTQEQIAEACGCGQSQISDLFRGRRGKRISYELGLKINELWEKNCAAA